MSTRIKPQTLRGFRDLLPNVMIDREAIMQTARDVFRSYGYAPIETPALEYSEILLGKGGEESDKQVFRFLDQGDRDVAMRFDLTVPLARFAAQHLQDIGLPFRRYHLGPVWRGERPARGRYREFMQCDFDVIGTPSNAADIETLLVINDLLTAIGFERFSVRVNNRRVLNGLLEKLGLEDNAVGILRSLDKLQKIGRDSVIAEMVEQVGVSPEQAGRVLDLAELSGDASAILKQLEELLEGNDTGLKGVADLRELFAAVDACELPAGRVVLDVSIARGLDYYTGTIYETFLGDLPEIGSVCSGGRYDNLAEKFTSQQLPGVGASLGLDRLLAAMEELGMLSSRTTPADVLVTMFDRDHVVDYLKAGQLLRSAGILVETYPDAKGLGKQLKFADRKQFRAAVIAGADEFASGKWQVRDLQSGAQSEASLEDLVDAVQTVLAANDV